jgi:hypothetical protein
MIIKIIILFEYLNLLMLTAEQQAEASKKLKLLEAEE